MTKDLYALLYACSKEVLVTKRSPRKVRKLRRKSEVAHRFKISAHCFLPVHHIIPLSLGGRHHPDNMACGPEWLHDAIQDFIDAQGELVVGQKAVRLIPVMQGKVWGLTL